MALASFLVFFICILSHSHLLTAENLNPEHKKLQTYIVHVAAPAQPTDDDLDSLYGVVSGGVDRPRILHRYRNVLTGFAAKLSDDELESIRQRKEFISARPEQVYELHTTHSPAFLGLHQNAGLWKGSNYGKGVVIGLLDTGITPEHPSFSDEGMPPPPPKWKGKCEFGGAKGKCNNKLIGARRFGEGVGTPADAQGHGTHTAATAAGNFVKGAAIFGNANGTAVGIAPLAHVAMYGVCSPKGCAESDIIAGIEAAIEDGVDVLSISLGGNSAPFYSDSIALGAYRAMEKGVLVVCSAGNSGPDYYTISNGAPWILTVGAATTDRKLTATVVLGNGEELNGESAFQPKDLSSLDLVYPGGEKEKTLAFCQEGELSRSLVEGKIVACELGLNSRIGKGMAVKKSGGAAMILMNSKPQGYTVSAEAHVLPASHIGYADTIKLKSYLNSTAHPKARIVFKGTAISDRGAPAVTYFSSRGPSYYSQGILKPDIIGPGNNILAAWNTSLDHNNNNNNNNNNHASGFNMISGTSMSCPHLSGVVALLKSAHPDWSPATIKSAIITTADQLNLKGKTIEDQRFVDADIFATGAGHVNPTKANDPGLIYDIQPNHYISYLCGLNYTNEQVGMLLHRSVDCSTTSAIAEAQLNYPSFSIRLGSRLQTYTRTVTNVGESKSLYHVHIVAPRGVSVKVDPSTLEFSKVGEELRYNVTFSRSKDALEENEIVEGGIIWSSRKHSVRSPVAVVFV